MVAVSSCMVPPNSSRCSAGTAAFRGYACWLGVEGSGTRVQALLVSCTMSESTAHGLSPVMQLKPSKLKENKPQENKIPGFVVSALQEKVLGQRV